MNELENLLKQLGLPLSVVDAQGHLIPGQLVKHYREQMKYSEAGKEKHWTQKDLADLLELKTQEVHRMENYDTGLDSMERREALIELLHIPPALLGLLSFSSTAELLEYAIHLPDASNQVRVNEEEIILYQDALHLYQEKYANGTVKNSLPALEKWIARLTNHTKTANSPQKPVLLRLLWKFHKLVAFIYECDFHDITKAFEHINEATALAKELDDADLQAACIYCSGDFYIMRGEPLLACKELDFALQIDDACKQTKGAIHIYAALAHAMTDTDLATTTRVQKLLDKAETYAGKDTMGSISFEKGRYLEDRADTLITLKRYDKALVLLDEAQEEYEDSEKRRLNYLNILRSECYIKQKKPEYEEAIRLLRHVLEENQSMGNQYHIQYVGRLYRLLTTSPCSTMPKVAQLGLLLKELKRK
jgi:tetratricopeptide (TPR) repeat protein